MKAYILRRVLQMFIVVIVATLFVFLVMRVLPGDPILMLMTPEEVGRASPEQIEALRREYGLDKPLLVQYVNWLSDVAHGDLGVSLIYRVPVTDLILSRLPISLHLGVVAIVISTILGILMGVVSAVRRATWLDYLVTVLANLGVTVPSFWLGILLLYLFGVYFGVLPIYGYTSPLDDLWMSIKQSIMPIICLTVFPMTMIARQTRSSMLEVLSQDYIRTAWAKGLRERLVISRHALKNSLIPIVTLLVVVVRFVLGGAVIIESIFAIPGLGRLAVVGITNHDYAVVQGVVLVLVLITVLVNLAIDLSYGWLDPRIRYE